MIQSLCVLMPLSLWILAMGQAGGGSDGQLPIVVKEASGTAAVGEARDRTQALIDALVEIDGGRGRVDPPADDATQWARTSVDLDDYFDLDGMTIAALATSSRRFSPEQLERYQTVARQLIRVTTYADSAGLLTRSNYSIMASELRDDSVTVTLRALNEEESLEMRITLVWRQVRAAARVVDLHVDGASLVRDYQHQFRRILRRDGVEGLISRLEERLAEEESRRGLRQQRD